MNERRLIAYITTALYPILENVTALCSTKKIILIKRRKYNGLAITLFVEC